MARLNLSVPDPLYERLDRLRDRVNASRVCAAALERELDAVEGRVSADNEEKIVRLLERLQGKRDRWYQRGWQDGEAWAVDTASASELRLVGDEWRWGSEDERRRADEWVHTLPQSFGHHLSCHVNRWVLADAWGSDECQQLLAHLQQRWGTAHIGALAYQHLLKDLGYYDGPVDGTPMKEAEAVKALQREHSLVETGNIYRRDPNGFRTLAVLLEAYREHATRRGDAGLPDRLLPRETLVHAGARVDLAAYMRGWYDAVKALWAGVKPRLNPVFDE